MIVRKSAAQIDKMRVAGRVVAEVLDSVGQAIVPGVTRTADLDQLAQQICRLRGAVPAFLGYRGFPACTCISVNEVVVHGIPDGRVLENGDIVSVDFACSVDGYFADSAITLPVGEVGDEAKRLLSVTREALYKGIAQARVGARLGDVASAVQQHAEKSGFGVVRALVGHGIGASMHEDPPVPNFGRPRTGDRLIEGTTIAIEPMITAGGSEVGTGLDGWTVSTRDGRLAAHFEHTVAVTKNGPEILTLLHGRGEPRGVAAASTLAMRDRDMVSAGAERTVAHSAGRALRAGEA